MSKYTPKTKDELIKLIKTRTIHLGDIDTSNITDMSELFRNINRNDFLGIEKWATSTVEDMRSMFAHCPNFNQDISSWNVSNVKNMDSMFYDCKNFDQDLSSWDVSNDCDKYSMFKGANISEEQAFNGELKEQSSKPKKQR